MINTKKNNKKYDNTGGYLMYPNDVKKLIIGLDTNRNEFEKNYLKYISIIKK